MEVMPLVSKNCFYWSSKFSMMYASLLFETSDSRHNAGAGKNGMDGLK